MHREVLTKKGAELFGFLSRFDDFYLACGATIWVRILRRSEEPYWRSRLVDDCRGATRLQGVF